MARTPEPLIFEGILAIEAAGGIDGFVREVLAESKRLSLVVIEQCPVSFGDEACKDILGGAISDVLLRRLKPDIDQGFSKRLGEAILACGSPDNIEAASQQAFAEAERWSSELFTAVQAAIFGDVVYETEGASNG